MNEETAKIFTIMIVGFTMVNILICGLTVALCMKMYTEYFKERVKGNVKGTDSQVR